MENSTKALLIAAGVLVVIVIVAMSISILNSSEGISDSADKVSDGVSQESDDVTKEAIGVLDDVNNKNLINAEDEEVNINYWYQNYFPQNPKILLEPDTEYTLSFDYKVIYADYTVGCGIGYGKTHYIKDILYSVTYPNQTEGRFIKTFKTPSTFITDEPYLQLRFARMNQAGNLSVEIENIKFKKVN